MTTLRKRILWLVLLLTVAAAIWPLPNRDSEDPAALGAQTDRSSRRAATSSTAAKRLGPLTPMEQATGEIGDLFPVQGFKAPQTTAVAEKPTAPPLPFTYGGRYVEGDKVLLILLEGAKTHSVHQGDTVNGTYRVDAIAPAAITLTYLPLGQQQTLQTGSSAAR